MSIVNSPSVVRGGAPAENDYSVYKCNYNALTVRFLCNSSSSNRVSVDRKMLLFNIKICAIHKFPKNCVKAKCVYENVSIWSQSMHL